MRKVLGVADAESIKFPLPGVVGGVLVVGHAGGTWTLQVEDPENPGTWIDTDITFTGNGLKSFDCFGFLSWRLAGGDVGARAWALSGRLVEPGVIGDR